MKLAPRKYILTDVQNEMLSEPSFVNGNFWQREPPGPERWEPDKPYPGRSQYFLVSLFLSMG